MTDHSERLESLHTGLKLAKETYGCAWRTIPPFEMLDTCFQEIDRLHEHIRQKSEQISRLQAGIKMMQNATPEHDSKKDCV